LEITVKYAELQKIIANSCRAEWLIHSNRMYVYRDDVLLTIELIEIDEQLSLSGEDVYPKLVANIRYGGSLIEQWPLLQTFNRWYSEIIPAPQLFFPIGARVQPFEPKRLEAVRSIFNAPDRHEAFDQAVTNIVVALEAGRESQEQCTSAATPV